VLKSAERVLHFEVRDLRGRAKRSDVDTVLQNAILRFTLKDIDTNIRRYLRTMSGLEVAME
jgi:hypothetical protein